MDYRWRSSWLRIVWRTGSVRGSVGRTSVDNVAEVFLIHRIGERDGTIGLQGYRSGNTLTGTGIGLADIGTQIG